MKKALLISGVLVALSTSPAAALTFEVFDLSTESGKISKNTWISNLGGQVTVLEDFESESADLKNSEDKTAGWYKSLETGVGTFTASGSAGTGATSYSKNGGSIDDGPHFSVQDGTNYLADNGMWFGRKNTTSGETASKWLDSGDISKLTLNLNDSSLTNLFFYLQDPSDVGATTTVNGNEKVEDIYNYQFANEADGTSFFVGITLDVNEILSQLSWSTGNSTGDGYGLDDFSTVAPVPEPATMLLFGTGLAGLASFRARRKTKK